MSNLRTETVLNVRHWTDGLFSFRTTRDAGFRFLNGQFTMIGLMVDGRPLLRAYSMASSHYEERLATTQGASRRRSRAASSPPTSASRRWIPPATASCCAAALPC